MLIHVSGAQVSVLQLGLKPTYFIFWMTPILPRLLNTQLLGCRVPTYLVYFILYFKKTQEVLFSDTQLTVKPTPL